MECKIPVNDIARTNMVTGTGTTLHKFNTKDGKIVYLPCLFYHLETAEICLFSLQTYHTLCRGHNEVHGDRIVKSLDDLQIKIPIYSRAGNVPMIQDCAWSRKEIQYMGPHVRSALPYLVRK